MTRNQRIRKLHSIARRSPARRSNTVHTRHSRRSERRRLWQLCVCGGAFFALVLIKLLMPDRFESLRLPVQDVLSAHTDVQDVFAAAGRMLNKDAVAQQEKTTSEEEDSSVTQSLPQPAESVQQDLDHGTSQQTSLAPQESVSPFTQPEQGDPSKPTEQPISKEPISAMASTVSYSELPVQVCMEQQILNFSYCSPLDGAMTSDFGYRDHPIEGGERFHYGLDIAAEPGSAIACFADGTVAAVGESSSYGKYLMVDHAGGFRTLYAHCKQVSVDSGSPVKAGQTIASVGETGQTTGPHLHFELLKEETYLNPIYYVS